MHVGVYVFFCSEQSRGYVLTEKGKAGRCTRGSASCSILTSEEDAHARALRCLSSTDDSSQISICSWLIVSVTRLSFFCALVSLLCFSSSFSLLFFVSAALYSAATQPATAEARLVEPHLRHWPACTWEVSSRVVLERVRVRVCVCACVAAGGGGQGDNM